MYTALVLDEISQEKLASLFHFPTGNEKLCHHMTVCMGSAEQKFPGLLGKEFSIQCISIGHSPQVTAIGVLTDCPSSNERKHITVSVNRGLGGKPVMSNQLTNWKPWDLEPTTLFGIVKECQ